MQELLKEELAKRTDSNGKLKKDFKRSKAGLKKVHERVFQDLDLQENSASPKNDSFPKIPKDPFEQNIAIKLTDEKIQNMRNQINVIQTSIKSFMESLTSMDEVCEIFSNLF